MKSVTYFFVILIALFCDSIAFSTEIPERTDIVAGKLPNGVRYVLKSHSLPKGRISVRMHIDTGSLNETDEQLGLAHFLEHLAFAGSEHFPDGTAIRAFEEEGLQFGAHVNALTSFTYTDYKLDLPNNAEKTASRALLFFADILDRLQLDEAAIERERLIILEEKRMAEMTPGYQLALTLQNSLFEGSLYPKRYPIGTEESIRSVTKEDFERYYRSYYRTDNTHIVIVGDMDTALMQELIEKQFGQIQPRDVCPESERTVLPTQKNAAFIKRDAIIKKPLCSVMRFLPLTTVETAEQRVVRTLAEMMLDKRVLGDVHIATKSEHPFYNYRAVEVSEESQDWKSMLTEAVEYLQQAKKYGFSKKELKEAKKEFISVLEAQAAFKAESMQLANEFVRAIREESPITSGSELLELLKSSIKEVGVEEINRWWQEFELKPYMVTLLLPKSIKKVPSEKSVLAAVKKALNQKVSRYKNSSSKPDKLFKDKIPEPAPIASITEYPESNITAILLENGIKVLVKQMKVPQDITYINAVIAGGKIEETAETRFYTKAACKANPNVFLDCYDDCLQFSMNGKDEETLFQMLHLQLQKPKIEKHLFEQWKDKKKHKLKYGTYSLQTWADFAFEECVLDPQEARFRTKIEAHDLDRINYKDARTWMKEGFRTAPIGVSIVSNVDIAKITELAQRYLGTLPARAEISSETLAEKRKLALQPGPYEVQVARPCEADAAFVVTGYMTQEAKGIAMHLLDLIVTQRLLQKTRMDEQLIYNLKTEYEADGDYSNFGYFCIKTSCSPENASFVLASMDEVLQNLGDAGPTEKELVYAKKIAALENDSVNNEEIHALYWSGALTDALWRKDIDNRRQTMLETGKIYSPDYESITQEELQTLMQKIVDPSNRIRIIVQAEG